MPHHNLFLECYLVKLTRGEIVKKYERRYTDHFLWIEWIIYER